MCDGIIDCPEGSDEFCDHIRPNTHFTLKQDNYSKSFQKFSGNGHVSDTFNK